MVRFIPWFQRYDVEKQKYSPSLPVTGLRYSKLTDPDACLHHLQSIQAGAPVYCVSKPTQNKYKPSSSIHHYITHVLSSQLAEGDLNDQCNVRHLCRSYSDYDCVCNRDNTIDSGISESSCLECSRSRHLADVRHNRYSRTHSPRIGGVHGMVGSHRHGVPSIGRMHIRLRVNAGNGCREQTNVLRKRLYSQKYYIGDESTTSASVGRHTPFEVLNLLFDVYILYSLVYILWSIYILLIWTILYFILS